MRERDVFRKVLRQVEGFSGVRVLTWTILSNHFHVLLEVPPPPGEPLTDDEILDRCRSLYPEKRMWDLSEFMKTLKQKFTGWFNREHERVGTLWESRFKSVVVEGSWECLLVVAAYIDLNAVRAGIVEEIFESVRRVFGAKRESGARKMKGGGWGELRALRVGAVTPPGGDG